MENESEYFPFPPSVQKEKMTIQEEKMTMAEHVAIIVGALERAAGKLGKGMEDVNGDKANGSGTMGDLECLIRNLKDSPFTSVQEISKTLFSLVRCSVGDEGKGENSRRAIWTISSECWTMLNGPTVHIDDMKHVIENIVKLNACRLSEINHVPLSEASIMDVESIMSLCGGNWLSIVRHSMDQSASMDCLNKNLDVFSAWIHTIKTCTIWIASARSKTNDASHGQRTAKIRANIMSIWKEIMNIVMANMLDQVTTLINIMPTVYSALLEICIKCDEDIALLNFTWKIVFAFVNKIDQEMNEDTLEVDKVLKYLSFKIIKLLDCLCRTKEKKERQKAFSLLRYFSSNIVHLVRRLLGQRDSKHMISFQYAFSTILMAASYFTCCPTSRLLDLETQVFLKNQVEPLFENSFGAMVFGKAHTDQTTLSFIDALFGLQRFSFMSSSVTEKGVCFDRFSAEARLFCQLYWSQLVLQNYREFANDLQTTFLTKHRFLDRYFEILDVNQGIYQLLRGPERPLGAPLQSDSNGLTTALSSPLCGLVVVPLAVFFSLLETPEQHQVAHGYLRRFLLQATCLATQYSLLDVYSYLLPRMSLDSIRSFFLWLLEYVGTNDMGAREYFTLNLFDTLVREMISIGKQDMTLAIFHHKFNHLENISATDTLALIRTLRFIPFRRILHDINMQQTMANSLATIIPLWKGLTGTNSHQENATTKLVSNCLRHLISCYITYCNSSKVISKLELHVESVMAYLSEEVSSSKILPSSRLEMISTVLARWPYTLIPKLLKKLSPPLDVPIADLWLAERIILDLGITYSGSLSKVSLAERIVISSIYEDLMRRFVKIMSYSSTSTSDCWFMKWSICYNLSEFLQGQNYFTDEECETLIPQNFHKDIAGYIEHSGVLEGGIFVKHVLPFLDSHGHSSSSVTNSLKELKNVIRQSLMEIWEIIRSTDLPRKEMIEFCRRELLDVLKHTS